MKPSGPGKKKEYRADRIMRMIFARVSVSGPKPGSGGRKRKQAPKVSGPQPKPGGGRRRRPRYSRPKR